MKQIENLAPLFSFPMFLFWLIFLGFLKIASDVLFPVRIVFSRYRNIIICNNRRKNDLENQGERVRYHSRKLLLT